MVEVLLKEVESEPAKGARRVTLKLVAAPLASDGIVGQFRVFPLTVPPPDALIKVAVDGKFPLTITLVAVDVPRLLTVTVQVYVAPARTVLGPLARVATSACWPTTVTARLAGSEPSLLAANGS